MNLSKQVSKIICVLLLLISGVMAEAQTRAPGLSQQEEAEKELAAMKADLALTPEQVEKVTPIIYSYAEEKIEIYDQHRANPSEIKSEMAEMHKRMDKDLSKVLTAEQLEKLKKIRESKEGTTGGPMNRQ